MTSQAEKAGAFRALHSSEPFLLPILGASGQPAYCKLIAMALDGLRAPAPAPLPDPQPGWELFSERWTSSKSPSTP